MLSRKMSRKKCRKYLKRVYKKMTKKLRKTRYNKSAKERKEKWKNLNQALLQ